MKSTKLMLAFLGTLILTWMFLATLFYLCTTDLSVRGAFTHGAVGFLMLLFGWIPSIIVCTDLDKKLA